MRWRGASEMRMLGRASATARPRTGFGNIRRKDFRGVPSDSHEQARKSREHKTSHTGNHGPGSRSTSLHTSPSLDAPKRTEESAIISPRQLPSTCLRGTDLSCPPKWTRLNLHDERRGGQEQTRSRRLAEAGTVAKPSQHVASGRQPRASTAIPESREELARRFIPH